MFYKSIRLWWIVSENKLVLYHDLYPAKSTSLSVDASCLHLKCQVVTAGRGRLLDASPLTAEEGLQWYPECLGGGTSNARNSSPCVESASGNCTNTSKYPKAFIYFKISRRGTDGDVSFAPHSPFWESRKSPLQKALLARKSLTWNKLNSHSPRLNQSGKKQRDHAAEVSGKTGWLKGACVSPGIASSVERSTLHKSFRTACWLHPQVCTKNCCEWISVSLFASPGIPKAAAKELARLSTGLSS